MGRGWSLKLRLNWQQAYKLNVSDKLEELVEKHTGSTQEKHLHNLHIVLSKLQESGFKLKKSKCTFMASKVQYFGHVIDKNGLHPSLDKVRAVRESKPSHNITS